MEIDRAAGKAQTGSKTVQLSRGGQGSEGSVGAVTTKGEEGHLAEPDTKLRQRSEGRFPLCRRELAGGDKSAQALSPIFSVILHQIPPPPSSLLRGKFLGVLQFCTLKRNRSKI